MNCGLRHLENDVMQLSYRHASICMNFSFNSLKKPFRDQRWPTAPLFVLNITLSLGEFTTSIRHILPIHNVTKNSKNLFVNFMRAFNYALRNRMTELIFRFGDFGLALPVQTHHSNKAGCTTVKSKAHR